VRFPPPRIAWFGINHMSVAHAEVNVTSIRNRAEATSLGRGNVVSPPFLAIANDQGKSSMQRLKSTAIPPSPRPSGSWFVGMVIGTAIMAIATQAIVLGTGAAITNATLKGR
jgi:hypothetical protein